MPDDLVTIVITDTELDLICDLLRTASLYEDDKHRLNLIDGLYADFDGFRFERMKKTHA